MLLHKHTYRALALTRLSFSRSQSHNRRNAIIYNQTTYANDTDDDSFKMGVYECLFGGDFKQTKCIYRDRVRERKKRVRERASNDDYCELSALLSDWVGCKRVSVSSEY